MSISPPPQPKAPVYPFLRRNLVRVFPLATYQPAISSSSTPPTRTWHCSFALHHHTITIALSVIPAWLTIDTRTYYSQTFWTDTLYVYDNLFSIADTGTPVPFTELYNCDTTDPQYRFV